MSATLHVHVLVSSENGRDRRQLVRHTWMDFFFSDGKLGFYTN